MPDAVLARFTAAHAGGELVSADRAGRAVAALALLADHTLNGEYVSIDDAPEEALVAAFDRLPPGEWRPPSS